MLFLILFLSLFHSITADIEPIEPYPVNMEIIGLSRPENAMSATEMRNYALDNDWKTFNSKMSSTGLDEAVIRNIFDGIIINILIIYFNFVCFLKRRRGGRSTRRNSNRRKANRRKNTRRNGKKRKATRRKANIRKSSKKTKK